MKAFLNILIASLIIVLSEQVSAQAVKTQVTELSIEKDYFREGENLTRIEFKVYADIENFTYEFDRETTYLTSATDDKGSDLLKQEQAYRESRPNSSHSEMIQFGGGDRDGFQVVTYIHGKPAPGSEVIRLKGQVGMVLMGQEESVHLLENLPVSEEDDGPEIESGIGRVWVDYRGKATVGETSYYQYGIGNQNPVIRAEVIGGDFSEEYRKIGLGLGEDSFVLTEVPETVDVRVTIRNREVKALPIDLEISVGF